MYERILEAIQQLREQGVEPTRIDMTIDCYQKCEDRLHYFEQLGIDITLMPLNFDRYDNITPEFIIM